MATNVEYVLSLKDLFTPKIKEAVAETDKLDKAMGKVDKTTTSMFGNVVKGLAIAGVGMLAKGVFDTAVQFEALNNQLGFASGSMKQGAQDFDYLKRLSTEMGLELVSATESFAKFSGAARGTSLEGQGVKDVFEGVAMASTVMHLSAEQSRGAFTALEQMMSKGKVSAEELRGQLGERIPGAFQIAARAMNMTTTELDKAMSTGQIMSDVFLPKFAAQLKKEFSGGMANASNSMQANMNRISNSWTLLKLTLGEGLGGAFASGMDAIQRVFAGINQGIEYLKSNIETLKAIFQPLIDVVVYAWDTIKGVFMSFNLSEMFSTWANALGTVFYILKPFAILLIDTLGFALKVVIGLVNGVAGLVVGIGKLFGYQEKKLGVKLDETDVLGQSKAMQAAVGANITNSTSPTSSNSGSRSAGLESRATQVSGSKPTSIVINVGKLVENQNFNGNIGQDIRNLAPQVRDEMIKLFLSMLNDSQQLASV